MHNRKFLKQLQQDNIDAYLLQREVCLIEKQHKQKTWRGKLLHILRSNPIQVILCALVLLDALIVVAEIILEMQAEVAAREHLKQKYEDASNLMRKSFPDALKDVPKEASLKALVEKLLATNLSCFGTTTALPTLVRRKRAAPDGSDTEFDYGSNYKLFINIAHKLHYTSIAILSIFVLDVILKMLCEGKHFFHEVFEVVDAVIIFLSFAADIAILKLALNQISLMIVFLLWRMVRVINGFMVHEKQRDEFRIQMQKRARRMCEMRIDGLKTEKELLEKQVKHLESLSRKQGATEDQIALCKPRYLLHSPKQTNNALKSMAALTGGFMRDLMNAKSRLDVREPGSNTEVDSTPRTNDFTANASGSSTSSTSPPRCSSPSSVSTGCRPCMSGDAADGVNMRIKHPIENHSDGKHKCSFSCGTSRVNSEELSIFATSTEQIVFVDSTPTDIDLSKPTVFENEAYVTKL